MYIGLHSWVKHIQKETHWCNYAYGSLDFVIHAWQHHYSESV